MSNKDGHNVKEAALIIVKKILDRRKGDTSENNISYSSTPLNRSNTQQGNCNKCC